MGEGEIPHRQQPSAGLQRRVEALHPPSPPLLPSFLPPPPTLTPSLTRTALSLSLRALTAESGSEDAVGRGRGSRCAVGAAGRSGARRRVGAGDAGERAGETRVQPAEAESYDRHRGS